MTRPKSRAARRPRARWLPVLLIVLSAANLVVVIIVLVCQRASGGRGSLGVALTYAPQAPWLAPSLLLALVAVVARKGWSLACNAAAALLVLFGLMGYTWSLHGRAAPNQPTIRVMTYNLAGGSLGTLRLLHDILEHHPDIAAFQEAAPWDGCLDPIEALLTALPDWHATRAHDLAVFSRFPISPHRVAPLPSGRPCLQVPVTTHGRTLTIINAHLSTVQVYGNPHLGIAYVASVAELHHVEGRALAAVAQGAPPPFIVLADLNSPPHAPPYCALRRYGVDAFGAAGRGFGHTFSAHRPMVRIDYIFVGRGLRVLKAWTPETGGSDHRPVVAEIAVLPAGR